MIRKDAKYIGDAIRNKLEVGDDVCVRLEDGSYYNRRVSQIDHLEDEERHVVTLGRPDERHIILWTEVEMVQSERGYTKDEEWTVGAYTLGDSAEEPKVEEADPERLYIVGEDPRFPDKYRDELEDYDDFRPEGFEEMREELENRIKVAEALLDELDRLEEGEITLREFEVRIDTLDVRYGGVEGF